MMQTCRQDGDYATNAEERNYLLPIVNKSYEFSLSPSAFQTLTTVSDGNTQSSDDEDDEINKMARWI
jgi:hypothetical protein